MTSPTILTAIELGLRILKREHAALHNIWLRFGQSIRAERKARKISLGTMARRLRVTPAYVAMLESGSRQWSMARARKAASIVTRRENWPDGTSSKS